MTKAGTFRASALTKALQAAQAAGFDPDEVRVCGGEIIMRRRGYTPDLTPADVEDELAAWERGHAKG